MGNTSNCLGFCSEAQNSVIITDKQQETQIVVTPTESQSNNSKNANNKQEKNKHSEQSEESEESEDDEYDEEALANLKNKAKKGARASVSAEVYGAFNKKQAFTARIIPKTEMQKNKIRERISQSFIFASLDDKALEIVINAMEIKNFNPGEWVIEQGELGDNLYVVETGALDCFKRFNNDTQPKYLKTYQPGESFGELALLYNVPRAASIQAKTATTVFCLDRECFSHIVKDSAIQKRQRYENFLAKIDLLKTMDAYERSALAEAIKTVKFKKGDYVMREGEPGNVFYFIEEGKAIATKVLKQGFITFSKQKSQIGEQGEAPQKVKNYGPGSYFGELALLKDQPRAANIIAETDLLLASVDRASFKRILGPLEEILKRNTSQYTKSNQNLNNLSRKQ